MKTSLFPPHIRAIAQALQMIFEDGQYADKVIAKVLKADKRRGSNDRAFIAENTYELVRWYRMIYTLRGGEPKTENDWWQMVGIRLILDDVTLPPWQEFRGLNPVEIKKKHRAIAEVRKFRESIPDWIDEVGSTELGDKWDETISALNKPSSAVLRVNTLRTTAKQLQRELRQDEISTKVMNDESLIVIQRKNLFRTEAFRGGLFELQDYSSQQVAPFSGVQPGMRVIDACAGAGGKTLHLATSMKNKGQIIAMDTEEWKLKELKKRAKRNGIHIIEPRPITSNKTIKRLRESADLVLLDVPCSGLGVLKRNPDAKWKLSPEFLEKVKEQQQTILSNYSSMVKKGGKLVYATCSILPSENRQQVDQFLASEKGTGFHLDKDQVILPQDEGFDGFYMARLTRE